MREDKTVGRPIKIDGMAYAPTNEQGVVFLFGRLAVRLGFNIEQVQTRFPDCTAQRRGKRCYIEFEYYASNYEGHPPRGADVVVCWDNDWKVPPKKYRHLEIIALRDFVEAPHRFFAVSAAKDKWVFLDDEKIISWGIPKYAQVGDLVIMYRRSPASEIRDLWKIVGPFDEDKEWGFETQMEIKTRLDKPVTFATLKNDVTTCSLGVIRKQFQGKTDITNDWGHLYAKIIQLNPKAKAKLREYHVD